MNQLSVNENRECDATANFCNFGQFALRHARGFGDIMIMDICYRKFSYEKLYSLI